MEVQQTVCGLCGSPEVHTDLDIGYDIDPSGEERQHRDKCAQCGAWRFHIERLHGFTEYKVHYGKWHAKDTSDFPACYEV
jgi:hypothetical protein